MKLNYFLPVLMMISASELFAQTITLQQPAVALTVAEGDDFATTVLGNPWDFAERRDIGWEEGFVGSSVGVSAGVWSGVNAVAGAYVFPLFGSLSGTYAPVPLADDASLPHLGVKQPIEAARYSLLSYKMDHSSRGTLAHYWTRGAVGTAGFPDGSNRGVITDGFFHQGKLFLNKGWQVYSFDLHKLSSSFNQSAGSWTGLIGALRIDPSVFAPTGAETKFDWIRLVDPGSAPNLEISWTASGIGGSRMLTLYVDDDSSVNDYNGIPLARLGVPNGPGKYSFPTAIFPPGKYSFYLLAEDPGAPGVSVVRSNYSASLRVSAKPKVIFNSPSPTSGEEYASDELSNPWDMSGPEDIANLMYAVWPAVWRQFTSEKFFDGLFAAVANPPLPGNAETDAQVHLNVPPGRPIDPARYRYLVYRMAIDAQLYPTIHDKVSNGWVSRPVFWNAGGFATHGRGAGHVVYEGWHSYLIDLHEPALSEFGVPWLLQGAVTNLRIDPLETTAPTWFYLDWVRLFAENRSRANLFRVSWNLNDLDSENFTVSLFRDNDRIGFDGVQIATFSGLSGGTHFYDWDTTGLPANSRHYLYLLVSDGTNLSRVYSPVDVVISGSAPLANRFAPRLDYDGDGISDKIVYRPASTKLKSIGRRRVAALTLPATFYLEQSVRGYTALSWGSPGYLPIELDIDGDRRSDLGLVSSAANGFISWYVLRSANASIYSQIWGYTGDRLVPADYDGDGQDEIAVWRPSDGTWYVLDPSGAVTVTRWGQNGDIPVPGDFNGDGKSDYGIFRPTDGSWWVLYSGEHSGGAAPGFARYNWGLAGDIPLYTDEDADGRDELIVYRPSIGGWFIFNTRTGSSAQHYWGLAGDTPIAGTDFNGDGIRDLVVVRRNHFTHATTWYVNYLNGFTQAVNWGFPSDLVPQVSAGSLTGKQN